MSSPLYAMNQITPTDAQSHQSDEDIVAAALPSDSPAPHPKLIPLLAATIRTTTNPEAAIVTKAVVIAANDVLGASVNKTTAGYIAAGSTILGAIITAIASNYGKHC